MFACEAGDEPASPRPRCLCHTPAFARLNAGLGAKFSGRAFEATAALFAAGAGASPATRARRLAFVNARIFDGRADALRANLRVEVEGRTIRALAPADSPVGVDVDIIDCGARVLMPGLIDAHWHAMMAAIPLHVLITADVGYINLVAAAEAERTLLRGFTSVRDMAGPAFGLKRAIDEGQVKGPRIWPSGAMISQTGGHGDFRFPYDIPSAPNGALSRGDAIGGGAIADGANRVLMRAREQLMLGASQIKLAAGGGVSSNYDPIDVAQYTEPEFRAAVDAAENWGTYVAVHAYTPRAIGTAIRAGVRCIEHGQLMDERTAELIATNDVWLSTQPFLDNEFAAPVTNPGGQEKLRRVFAGTDAAYTFARKHGIRTAWGTDVIFAPEMTKHQGAMLTTLTQWYTPVEILRMATSVNGELLAMSGPRSPYPGKLGMIEEGAVADLILVDGDPTEDIGLVADPEKNFVLIMKDGRIEKKSAAVTARAAAR